jgi:hypothetical protein
LYYFIPEEGEAKRRLSQWPMKEKRPLRTSAKDAKKSLNLGFKKTNNLALLCELGVFARKFLGFLKRI